MPKALRRRALWVRYPFVMPEWTASDVAAATCAPSDEVSGFESDFRAFIGRSDGYATGSGRLALELAVRAVAGRGDEVIVPTFACGAVYAAVRAAGATPVYADVTEDWGLAPSSVSDAESPRTKAVVVVHDGGRRADVERIRSALAGSVTLIEDCAQATAAGAPVVWGRSAKLAIWSFGLGKNLMATAGGFVAGVDRQDLQRASTAAALRRLSVATVVWRLARYTRPFVVLARRSVPAPPEDRTDVPQRSGMAAPDASLMRGQLRRASEILAARRRNALVLLEELADDPRVILPPAADHAFTKFHLTLRDATRPAAVARAPELHALTRALLRAGFEPEASYTPLHLRFPGGREVPRPVAEDLYWRTFTLPVRPGIPVAEMRRMAAVIREHLRR